ncbi:hypothetical protein B5X24_HaOG207139 [Helicoverpa armigera]|uniref:Uncharacterized protein n=1 Tax=Helicoverpa armigera TaxID=29058 RepID=A0A2W1BPM4_HELAM|nr:hypothetical protein B5X24_HaOG207139 [Helicoverpa armigera]
MGPGPQTSENCRHIDRINAFQINIKKRSFMPVFTNNLLPFPYLNATFNKDPSQFDTYLNSFSPHLYMDPLKKRKRGQTFLTEEKDKLVKLLTSHRETILNKNRMGPRTKP